MVPTAELPTPQQALTRALGLTAVICRGRMEAGAHDRKAKEMMGLVHKWLLENDLGRELLPEELAVVGAPLGSLDRTRIAAALWRVEQVGVLGWALGRVPLGAPDETPHDRWLARRIGFVAVDASERIATASFRPEVEIHRFARTALAVEARLKQFAVDRKPMDFQSFCKEGGIVGLKFVDGDLRISGVALAEAPASRWQAILVSAVERARAARWLTSPRLVAVRHPVDA